MSRRRHSRFAPLAALLLLVPGSGNAQQATPPLPPLAFFGFEAGAPLAQVASRIRSLDGSLRCDRSRTDRRVLDCRGTVADPALGGRVEVWLSSIDSVAAVLTLSGQVGGEQLDTWRDSLETAYGRVGARAKGPQWTMQWVRRGRMIRLTWKTGPNGRLASVALVDGTLLDRWGRTTERGRPL